MPTPETPILDESAVSEIESRPWFWPAHDEWRETPLSSRHVILTVAERDALCATVKHLRAVLKETNSTLDAVRRRADTNYQCSSDLQSQLEQLQAENQLLKIATADPADKEYGATVYDSKGNYTVLAQNAIDRNVSELRSRAIQLCKDKAAEWHAQYDTDVTGDHDDKVYFARAATALAAELEKL